MGRLQRGEDEECRFFQRIAEQGHYAGRTLPSTTRQGIYAAAPSGLLLGSLNTRHRGEIARMLESALERWEALPREERLPAQAPGASPPRWEDRYPEDGLVLRVQARDLPREAPVPDWRARAWNRDFAWFTRAEARALLPAEFAPGAAAEWPGPVAERIVRFHLVDNVRGQVSPFPEGSVERARIWARIVAAGEETVEAVLEGETRAETRGRWAIHGFRDGAEPQEQVRGFEARLLGRATFDRREGRFTAFEMVAVGSRWGGTQFNGRGDDLDPSPIGVVFALAGSGPSERIPPAAIHHYGWR